MTELCADIVGAGIRKPWAVASTRATPKERAAHVARITEAIFLVLRRRHTGVRAVSGWLAVMRKNPPGAKAENVEREKRVESSVGKNQSIRTANNKKKRDLYSYL